MIKWIKQTKNKIKVTKVSFVVLLVLLGCLLFFGTSLSRFIYNGVKNYYFESQNFYFNCDKLAENEAIFQLDNWDGVTSFEITFNMNSFKNNLVSAKSNIEYDIEYECSSKATCTISKESGLIPTTTHEDYFTITVVPNQTLVEGDSIVVNTSVTSTSPYVKTLTGKVTLNVGIPGISYEISDKVNQPYLNFSITNTFDYYQVVTAFDSYAVGDTIESSVYSSLSSENKEKCTSIIIRLDFDPRVILIDMTSEFYDNAYEYTTTMIDGKEYINSVKFGMDAVSSMNIRFYKVEASNNYTYPYVNPTSVIGFNVL